MKGRITGILIIMGILATVHCTGFDRRSNSGSGRKGNCINRHRGTCRGCKSNVYIYFLVNKESVNRG